MIQETALKMPQWGWQVTLVPSFPIGWGTLRNALSFLS